MLLIVISIIIFLAYCLYSRRYSIPCPSWLAWLVEVDNPFTTIHHASIIIEHLELQPGMIIVDVGCGPGRVTIPLALKIFPTGHVVAMDIQAGMIRRIEEKARNANLSNITFIQAGIGQGKLEHGRFDRALLVTVLGEIPDQKNSLKEIFDALKPGGLLSITEIIFDPHFQRYGKVLCLANKIGFRQKKKFGNCFAYNVILEKPIL